MLSLSFPATENGKGHCSLTNAAGGLHECFVGAEVRKVKSSRHAMPSQTHPKFIGEHSPMSLGCGMNALMER